MSKYSRDMKFLLFFWILVFCEASRSANIKVVDGTWLKQVYPVPYGASMPMVFRIRIPKQLIGSTTLFEKCIKEMQSVMNHSMRVECDTLMIYKDIMETIRSIENDVKPTSSTKKFDNHC